ncbi:hypothetical protein BAUCODRAFT_144802 [Baudoinia panamericana UAMH 10762]|uniref:Uncharacterized protein n=1 Tax=Baudoinia panamericana (strain UAMH 10762) TaxID=717646 RepID=M2NQD3_BAUPA|nr:uncharacterized protein BAUCODRAFT_144802 [Baudoinia panamericana UAMH 10762]EMD01256.1 hypothetical protein BAUCODRAFT_144802 [Baudoinia panamericana UAMH 10762]
MDVVQDWAAYFLGSEQAAFITYSPYLYRFYNAASTIKSWLLPLIDQVIRKPDLATIALLLVIVILSLKVLDMLWQTVVFWFKMARRLLFWGVLAALGLWMWTRGPEGVWEDVQYWSEAWGKEYGYWKEQEKVARLAAQGRNYGGKQQRPVGWF